MPTVKYGDIAMWGDQRMLHGAPVNPTPSPAIRELVPSARQGRGALCGRRFCPTSLVSHSSSNIFRKTQAKFLVVVCLATFWRTRVWQEPAHFMVVVRDVVGWTFTPPNPIPPQPRWASHPSTNLPFYLSLTGVQQIRWTGQIPKEQDRLKIQTYILEYLEANAMMSGIYLKIFRGKKSEGRWG